MQCSQQRRVHHKTVLSGRDDARRRSGDALLQARVPTPVRPQLRVRVHRLPAACRQKVVSEQVQSSYDVCRTWH